MPETNRSFNQTIKQTKSIVYLASLADDKSHAIIKVMIIYLLSLVLPKSKEHQARSLATHYPSLVILVPDIGCGMVFALFGINTFHFSTWIYYFSLLYFFQFNNIYLQRQKAILWRASSPTWGHSLETRSVVAEKSRGVAPIKCLGRHSKTHATKFIRRK